MTTQAKLTRILIEHQGLSNRIAILRRRAAAIKVEPLPALDRARLESALRRDVAEFVRVLDGKKRMPRAWAEDPSGLIAEYAERNPATYDPAKLGELPDVGRPDVGRRRRRGEISRDVGRSSRGGESKS